MANFLESLFAQLNRADDRVVLREIRGEQFLSVAGSELLEQVGKVRAFLRHSGIQPGDRCALLAPNSIAWVAIDLAMMAEGVIVVPLYARQAADELAGKMKDCRPRLLFVRSEEHTSELQSRLHIVCRLLLDKKKQMHTMSVLS